MTLIHTISMAVWIIWLWLYLIHHLNWVDYNYNIRQILLIRLSLARALDHLFENCWVFVCWFFIWLSFTISLIDVVSFLCFGFISILIPLMVLLLPIIQSGHGTIKMTFLIPESNWNQMTGVNEKRPRDNQWLWRNENVEKSTPF